MIVCKTYKFRMYPDNKTLEKLNQFFDVKRFIYNYFLSKKDEVYDKEHRNYSLKEMQDELNKLYIIYPWLKDSDAFIIKNAIEDLDITYQKYIKGLIKHPNYKSKCYKQTYRTNHFKNSYYHIYDIKVDLLKHTIKLPKLNPIIIRNYKSLKSFDKDIINVTVSKEAGRYYVSVVVKEKFDVINKPIHNIVGIDIGIKNIITTSEGIKYDKMPNMKRYNKKLDKLNYNLSKMQRGSNNSYKNIVKIERVYMRIKNTRKYYIYSVLNDILKDYDCIVTETLNVENMIGNANKTLRKNISNTSFQKLLSCIAYKTKWQGKKHINIDTYYPSSKICNHCDCKNNIDLDTREFICKNCGSYLDRDINASINILWEGIKKIYS